MSTAGDTGMSDFDFLIGSWSVVHRRLQRRLAGDTTWIEFTGPAAAQKILAGFGNLDELHIDLPADAYVGSTLRLYNPSTREWSIYWMDSRNPKLDPALTGHFRAGVGVFFGTDVFEGRPIDVRFIWSSITPSSCRWEQAFSIDGRKTWETNWIMKFTRTH